MIGSVLLALAVIGLIVWLIWQEMKHHEENNDLSGWRLGLICGLILFLGLILCGGSCRNESERASYRIEPTGDSSGWDDR